MEIVFRSQHLLEAVGIMSAARWQGYEPELETHGTTWCVVVPQRFAAQASALAQRLAKPRLEEVA